MEEQLDLFISKKPETPKSAIATTHTVIPAPTKEANLEERAEVPTEPVRLNRLKNYGIQKNYLQRLVNENNSDGYSAIENLFYGVNIAEKLPREALQQFNTSEIIALYIGIGQIRRYSWMELKSRDNTRKSIEFDEFSKLPTESMVTALVSHGATYEGYTRIRDLGFSGFESTPKGLKERIASLPENIRQKLRDAILYVKPETRERKKSSVDTKNEPNHYIYDFYDHNAEGMRDYTAKSIYVKECMSSLHTALKR